MLVVCWLEVVVSPALYVEGLLSLLWVAWFLAWRFASPCREASLGVILLFIVVRLDLALFPLAAVLGWGVFAKKKQRRSFGSCSNGLLWGLGRSRETLLIALSASIFLDAFSKKPGVILPVLVLLISQSFQLLALAICLLSTLMACDVPPTSTSALGLSGNLRVCCLTEGDHAKGKLLLQFEYLNHI